MRELFYQVGRGFAFGGVVHPELSTAARWVPISISFICAVTYFILPVKPPLVGDGGLSRHLISVFSTLPGFFIAALAAVATFSRPEMDMTMPAPAPKLRLKVGPEQDWVELTFRMFLSHLFGYLTTLAFVAVFVFVGVDLLSGSGSYILSHLVHGSLLRNVAIIFNVLYVVLACWLSAKVVFTTLLGIYFLAERIHRPSA